MRCSNAKKQCHTLRQFRLLRGSARFPNVHRCAIVHFENAHCNLYVRGKLLASSRSCPAARRRLKHLPAMTHPLWGARTQLLAFRVDPTPRCFTHAPNDCIAVCGRQSISQQVVPHYTTTIISDRTSFNIAGIERQSNSDQVECTPLPSFMLHKLL